MTEKERVYLFHKGEYYDAFDYFGCHIEEGGATFRVYAPRADAVWVTGEFNRWQKTPLVRNGDIWQVVVPDAGEGQRYRYVVRGGGNEFSKSDPYAFFACTREDTDSVIYRNKFLWTDDEYMRRRDDYDVYHSPVNIYEAHIGSWRKDCADYRSFADAIAPYLKRCGYTHLELMGVAEYPLDDSWGYQVTGYFAPTSRYGTPEDFAYLVNTLHRAGIGIIIDWVAGHFPKNRNGLYEFDGAPLYEPSDEIMSEHKGWGTKCFDYSRPEVRSFLISNAVFWLREYHCDGLRADAVASMIYLDYGRNEWRKNDEGGNLNKAAIAFLQQLNCAVFARFRGIIMAAEESTAYPKVTHPVHEGGLGFNFKWNMGWMNDSLKYMSIDPLFRGGNHSLLTFSFYYAFSENFILPLSHDEVVYGKKSLLNKMFGDYEERFAALRCFMAYAYAHPGKKLSFMGNEIAQFDEWDFRGEICYDLLNYPSHAGFFEFMRRLNHIYLKYAPLWQDDGGWQGFEWITPDDKDNNIIVFKRKCDRGDIIALFNFSPVKRNSYRFGSDRRCSYRYVLYTDADGGERSGCLKPEKIPFGGKRYSITTDIPPYCAAYLYARRKI